MSLLHKIRRISMERKSNKALNDRLLLEQLISDREWEKVSQMLADDASEPNRSRPLCSIAKTTDDLILHGACEHSAPLPIVIKLCIAHPSSVRTIDDRGMLPLHVAVYNGCHPDMIDYLIKAYPDSAGAQDSAGKTPLHHAAESYSENFVYNFYDFPDFREVHKSTLHVVQLLVDAAPASVNIEDEDEMNPIEYALLNATHIKIVKFLQRSSRKDWRHRKTEEHKSHEDLCKELQDSKSPEVQTEKSSISSWSRGAPVLKRVWAATA